MWLGWLLSQTWIAIHIWAPKCERLATTEKLFVNPMYSGVIIDQSIALNRRRDDEEEIKSEDINLETDGTTMQDPSQHYETISEHMDDKKKSNTFSSDQIIRIYACATMWHETAEEMIQMLKSVFRMDEDQSARRNAQKYLKIVDPDYYEFEGILNKHSKLLFLFLNTTCFQFIFSLTMLLNCVMKTTKKWL
jgi:chitin synthase